MRPTKLTAITVCPALPQVEEYLPRTLADLLRDLRTSQHQRQMTVFVGLSVAVQARLQICFNNLIHASTLYLHARTPPILIRSYHLPRSCVRRYSTCTASESSTWTSSRTTCSSQRTKYGYATPLPRAFHVGLLTTLTTMVSCAISGSLDDSTKTDQSLSPSRTAHRLSARPC